MAKMIPVANPHARYVRHQEVVKAAIIKVLESGRYIKDAHVANFEREFAAYQNTKHCLGVANGTDALVVGMKGLGVASGDEVITVSHTAVATTAAIELCGAVPVFADIEEHSRCLNPKALEKVLSSKTKIIIPVHIYGQPADMPEIMSFASRYGLKVIEDCAQAHGAKIGGARVGTFGDVAAFSFYPTKNLGCFGDGGAVTTNSDAVMDRMKLYSQYGWRERYISEISGGNSRLDELHAAVLSELLPHLDFENARRAEIAAHYQESCKESDICFPLAAANTEHVFHLFVVQISKERRTEFREHLLKYNVQSALHYPYAIHQQPAYQGKIKGCDALLNTEALYETLVSLPMFPELSDADVSQVCQALTAWK